MTPTTEDTWTMTDEEMDTAYAAAEAAAKAANETMEAIRAERDSRKWARMPHGTFCACMRCCE